MTTANSDRLLGTADEIVMGLFVQRNRTGAETLYAYDQILVLVGFLLGFMRFFGTHDVANELAIRPELMAEGYAFSN